MRVALVMAQRGLGRVAPNPAVGAVVADEERGEIISRGWTQPGGRPHAEPEALAGAGARAKGATLYVTLEPCSHHGRTPPCADAIIAAGIARVVVGILDPDPRVSGRGVDRLRAAGVEVVRGVLPGQVLRLTKGHIVRVSERRPFVQLKMAVGADGRVARGQDGRINWVTGELARQRGHLLRARSDAILVGRQTVIDDDPDLTCRLPGLGAFSPVRIVLAGADLIARQSVLVRGASKVPVWVFAAEVSDEIQRDRLAEAGVEVIRVPQVAGRLWLPSVMEELVARGITRLLVEGGPTTWLAFAERGLVDEIVEFRPIATVSASSSAGHSQCGAGTAVEAATHPLSDLGFQNGEGLDAASAQRLGNMAFRLVESRVYENDMMRIYRRD